MTYLQYYAGQALVGLLASQHPPELVEAEAIKHAHAMCKFLPVSPYEEKERSDVIRLLEDEPHWISEINALKAQNAEMKEWADAAMKLLHRLVPGCPLPLGQEVDRLAIKQAAIANAKGEA